MPSPWTSHLLHIFKEIRVLSGLDLQAPNAELHLRPLKRTPWLHPPPNVHSAYRLPLLNELLDLQSRNQLSIALPDPTMFPKQILLPLLARRLQLQAPILPLPFPPRALPRTLILLTISLLLLER